MGCFDYTCLACNGIQCGHNGSQFCCSIVAIFVKLNDDTEVYLRGYYEEYGYVIVRGPNNKDYTFYLKEFEDCIGDWIKDENPEDKKYIFLAEGAITIENEIDDHNEQNCFCEETVSLTDDIIKKCIKAS